MPKGANDVPAYLMTTQFNTGHRMTGIPIGSSMEYEKVHETLKGGNVDAKYTNREILDILTNARYFIIKSAS